MRPIPNKHGFLFEIKTAEDTKKEFDEFEEEADEDMLIMQVQAR